MDRNRTRSTAKERATVRPVPGASRGSGDHDARRTMSAGADASPHRSHARRLLRSAEPL